MFLHRALLRAGLPVAVLAATVAVATSAQSPSDPILVENGAVVIRKSDFDSEVGRLPPDIRPGFANSERRVNELLRRMLLERTLAAQARAEKLDQSPSNALRLASEIDKLYAQLKVAQIEEAAAVEFDARRGAWEARAREIYKVDRRKYETPEQVQASHILFETRSRSRDEAKRLADEARARIVAGADFNQVARELSEDRSAKNNDGRLSWFSRSDMDAAFANAAFALQAPGEVSQPVLSSFGWHLIRLDGRRAAAPRPFDEVKDQILGELKQKHVDEAREAAITRLRNDPTIRAHREAIDALVIRTDREVVRRAQQQAAPAAPAAPR
jgi:peptidyl-prolyl cis-trans isomerase C